MVDNPVELDEHRGMAAQKATVTRRQRIQEFQGQQTSGCATAPGRARKTARDRSGGDMARGRRQVKIPYRALRQDTERSGSTSQKTHRPCARRSQAVVCSKKGQFMKYFLGVDATNEQRPNDTPRSANASDAKPTFRARGPASVSACAVKIQPHGGPAY